MAVSNIAWKGMKALEVMANTLPDKISGKKLSEAYKYALLPTKDAMLRNIPNDKTGALKYSIDTTISGGPSVSTMFGVVGSRRKKHTWNMSGWHSHLIESGTQPHDITAGPGKLMPIFTKAGFTGEFAKTIRHKGSRGTKPFRRAMDSTWRNVSIRVSDKVAEIMSDEIKLIWRQFGSVETKEGGQFTRFDRMGGRDPSALFKAFGRIPVK